LLPGLKSGNSPVQSARFAVHPASQRQPSPQARPGPCCEFDLRNRQPQDVPGSVHVPVQAQPTVRAVMPPLVQLFRDQSVTSRTHLRRIAWVYGHNLPPGRRRFVLEEGKELPPTNVSRRPCHALVLQHELRADCLVGNQRVSANQGSRCLVMSVGTLVSNLQVQTLELPNGPLPAVASLLLPGKFPLQPLEPLQTAMQVLCVRIPFPIAGSDERLNPQVDTDQLVRFRILRSRNVVAGEASVPLPSPILDGKGLDGALDGTRPLHLDGTDVCDVEPAITQFPPRLVREGKGSVPAGGLELRIASTSEEPLERLVQA